MPKTLTSKDVARLRQQLRFLKDQKNLSLEEHRIRKRAMAEIQRRLSNHERRQNHAIKSGQYQYAS